MQNNTYKTTIEKMAERIRNSDYEAFAKLMTVGLNELEIFKYGENIVFENQDFSNVDFEKFNLGFTKFSNCVLDNSKNFTGSHVEIDDSSCRGIDLSGCSITIIADNSDFSGIIFDKDTTLAVNDDSKMNSSIFTKCKFDKESELHIKKQGVVFNN